MNGRRKIEALIRKKEAEVQALEAQARDGRVYLQALQDVLRTLPRTAPTAANAAASTLRAGSTVALAREAILKRGAPMHVTELLTELGKEPTRENRASLSGSLSAYVRNGEIFTRPAPNQFGLVELGDADAVIPTSEPPADFGEITDSDDDEAPF